MKGRGVASHPIHPPWISPCQYIPSAASLLLTEIILSVSEDSVVVRRQQLQRNKYMYSCNLVDHWHHTVQPNTASIQS